MASSRSWMPLAACALIALFSFRGPAHALAQSSETKNPPQTSSTQSARQPQQARPAIFIKGTVRDPSGAPIPGATVVLEEKGSGSVEAKTGQDGTFSFLSLRAGTFTVRAKAQAFQESVTEPLQLSLGEKKQIDLVLKVATYSGVFPVTPAQPNGGAATQAQPAAPREDKGRAHKAEAAGIEFSDEPNFTVAGITDWSNAGLHGSDVTARTSEALNKETLALKSSATNTSAGSEKATAGAASAKASEADTYRLAGDAYESKGDALAAERKYESAVRLDPSEPNYFAWGTELLVHRAIQPAVEVYTKAAAAFPDSSRMLIGLGAALYASRSYDQAARRVCQASEKDPGNEAPYLFLGKMQETVSEPLPCVMQALARFVQQHRESAQANYFYAVALGQDMRIPQDAADFQKQEALLHKALTLDPKLAEAHVQLGALYFGQNRLAEAIVELQKAIAANPELADAHYRLGMTYKKTGEEAKAAQEFENFKRIQKTQADAEERQRKEMQQFVVVLKDKSQQ